MNLKYNGTVLIYNGFDKAKPENRFLIPNEIFNLKSDVLLRM
jgi:hypothetical protein